VRGFRCAESELGFQALSTLLSPNGFWTQECWGPQLHAAIAAFPMA
jgi:hypothetical protein